MSFRQPRDTVNVTLKPLHSGDPRDPQYGSSAGPASEGDDRLPQRWQQAVDNLESAVTNLDQLAQALDGALYLDDDEWQKALPVHKYNMAIQVQHHKIGDLERRLADLQSKLCESERGKVEAEDRVKELNEELESNARVFQLHYDELMRKEKEISELQAVVTALSLGGGTGGGGGSDGGGLGNMVGESGGMGGVRYSHPGSPAGSGSAGGPSQDGGGSEGGGSGSAGIAFGDWLGGDGRARATTAEEVLMGGMGMEFGEEEGEDEAAEALVDETREMMEAMRRLNHH